MRTWPLCSILFLSACCALLGGCAAEPDSSVWVSDGEWELKVDREWAREGDQSLPRSLTEDDYRLVSDGPRYSVVVTDGCKKVEIREVGAAGEHPPKKGATHASGDPAVYWLQEGTFAGGQFVLLRGDRRLEAELTMFGSGVPITSSERGSLSKKL